jgi:hypothetical protein
MHDALPSARILKALNFPQKRCDPRLGAHAARKTVNSMPPSKQKQQRQAITINPSRQNAPLT